MRRRWAGGWSDDEKRRGRPISENSTGGAKERSGELTISISVSERGEESRLISFSGTTRREEEDYESDLGAPSRGRGDEEEDGSETLTKVGDGHHHRDPEQHPQDEGNRSSSDESASDEDEETRSDTTCDSDELKVSGGCRKKEEVGQNGREEDKQISRSRTFRDPPISLLPTSLCLPEEH